MDAAGERLFLIVRQPVEDTEGGMEQDFRQQPVVHPCPVLPVKQLHRRFQDGGSAILGTGRRPGRRAGRLSATAGHLLFCPVRRSIKGIESGVGSDKTFLKKRVAVHISTASAVHEGNIGVLANMGEISPVFL